MRARVGIAVACLILLPAWGGDWWLSQGIVAGPAPVALAASEVVWAPGDSARAREDARAAQRRFERLRIRHLPTTTPFSGRPDERVGRFHFWHGDGREPAPERPAVIEARAELIRTLDSLATLAPDDWWVTGHLVRYLVEAREGERAAEAARSCRSEAWWCDALLGFAFHAAGEYERSDSAYRAARERMPEEVYCRWSDLSLLLEGSARRDYMELPCPERSGFEAAFWRLADPLWILPGNDRRTEHFSRHVMDRLQDGAASGYAVRWGSDLRELLLRYGWPVGFERVRRPGLPVSPGRPDVQAHDAPGMRWFAPRADWVTDPPPPVDWDLDSRPARSYYVPPYAREFVPLEHETDIFRRGEGGVLVTTFDFASSRPGLAACDSLVAGVGVAGSEPEAEPRLAVGHAAGERGVFRMEVPPPAAGSGSGARVISVEAFCPETGVAARSRGRLVLPSPTLSGVGVSDLLLVDGQDPALPESLEQAASRARLISDVRPGERLMIFWELYRAPGPPRAGRIALSLTLQREGDGLFRRALRWVGLAGEREDGPALGWREAYPETLIVPRAVSVSLPELPAGEYRLELEVRSPGQEPLVKSQSLKVVEERMNEEPGDG